MAFFRDDHGNAYFCCFYDKSGNGRYHGAFEQLSERKLRWLVTAYTLTALFSLALCLANCLLSLFCLLSGLHLPTALSQLLFCLGMFALAPTGLMRLAGTTVDLASVPLRPMRSESITVYLSMMFMPLNCLSAIAMRGQPDKTVVAVFAALTVAFSVLSVNRIREIRGL